MQSIAGLAHAVETHAPEVREIITKKTIENTMRRYLERFSLKALLLRVSAHNTSPFSEQNNGALSMLHTKIVSFEQQLKEQNDGGLNSEDAAARLMEARQEYEMIKRAEEHYRLVHYKVLGFISKLQGLAQV